MYVIRVRLKTRRLQAESLWWLVVVAVCHQCSCPFFFLLFFYFFISFLVVVPAGSPSSGGDVTVYALNINIPTELAHSFYSVLVPVSVFMALSTLFHSIYSSDNSLLSRSVLLVLFLPYWSFQLYIVYESLIQP